MKAAAALHLGVGPYLSAVTPHDAPHRRQADTGALEVICAVQALEDAEQPVREPHIEAGAVVPNAVGGLAVVQRAFEPDLRIGLPGGVLPGVAEQVLERNAQQRRIALYLQTLLDVHADHALRRLAAQIVGDVAGELRQVHRLSGQRSRRQLRQRQQRIDHAVHARGGAEHAVQMVVADAV